MSRQPAVADVPEDEELDCDEEMEEFEMPDAFEALTSLLATEEGETVATALVGLKDATERIATNLEMQNKILVKILTAVSKAKACECCPTSA
jgi:hypothetical protein